MLRLSLIAALWLAACAPTAPDDTVPTDPDRPAPGPSETGGEGLAEVELCDAEDYRQLIGSAVAATSFPQGPNLRVFSLTDIVTQEYLPSRTNVVYDNSGTIVRVYCG